MTKKPNIYIVDDDEQVRKSVASLVESMGGRPRPFESAEAFLDEFDSSHPGCVVTDVRMDGMSGLELQRELRKRQVETPVIVITAFASTRDTVDAMQDGAFTVLEKPCGGHELFDTIRAAVAADRRRRRRRERRSAARQRLDSLTPDEKEILDRVVAGERNKDISEAIGVGVRTVEMRRQRVFRKLGAASVAELVRMVLTAEGAEKHEEGYATSKTPPPPPSG